MSPSILSKLQIREYSTLSTSNIVDSKKMREKVEDLCCLCEMRSCQGLGSVPHCLLGTFVHKTFSVMNMIYL